MRERDCAYRRAKRHNSQLDFERFKALRRQISNAINTARNTYTSLRIASARDSRSKWNELRRLGLARSRPSAVASIGNVTLNQINSFFSSISSAAPPLTECNLISTLALPPYADRADADVDALPPFRFRIISCKEVTKLLTHATSRATGPDGIGASMLRLLPESAYYYIREMMNSSLCQAVFPVAWKHAQLIPLPKVTSPKALTDIRPIAILPELSKLLERAVHDQLLSHLETRSLLNPFQAGFRQGHSTQTALLYVMEHVRAAIDKRMLTILVLFDFSKAFDTVPHAPLLIKLRRVGCADEVVRWFASYLTGRTHSVLDRDGTVSDSATTSSGVPQGSVLGPLLFSIFVNDLPRVLTKARHVMFADDLQIFHSCLPSNLSDGIAQANLEAASVASWASANGLRLNADKSKVIVLGSEQYLSRIDFTVLPPLEVLGCTIPYVNRVKTLGVTLAPSLDWGDHVAHVLKRVYTALYGLRHHQRALHSGIRKHLVESLIFPHFDYACAVYHDLYQVQDARLQTALNACVRFVKGNLGRREHVTPHRLSLGWLSVRRRREYLLGCLAYQVISREHPAYLAKLFKRAQHDVIIRTSARLPPRSLVAPIPRTEAYKQSFVVTASSLLNSLGHVAFSARLILPFKEKLFKELLARDRSDWENRVEREGLLLTA